MAFLAHAVRAAFWDGEGDVEREGGGGVGDGEAGEDVGAWPGLDGLQGKDEGCDCRVDGEAGKHVWEHGCVEGLILLILFCLKKAEGV